MSERLTLFQKELYGRKSEKVSELPAEQMALDALLAQVQTIENTEAVEALVVVKPHQRRKKHPGRNAIPEDITRKRIVYDIPEAEKTCACCGRPKVVIGETVRKEVERIPATYVVNEHVRPKYACKHCKDGVTVAEPPVSPIPRGLAGLQLLIFVILSKYQYHLPLYRIQRQIFHESRIWFTRSTMVGWIQELCVLLKRVYDAMVDEVKAGRYIHADESLLTLVGGEQKSKTTYQWVYRGPRTVVFDYRNTRGGDGPMKFLAGVPSGTFLIIDGYSGYIAAVDKYDLLMMICMTHLRRQFIEAAEVGSQKDFALRIIRFIGQLYRIERYATAKNLDAAGRFALRQNLCPPIMDKIKAALVDPPFVKLPQSRIGKAINYALARWDEAQRYLQAGDLPIDNNPAEQVIRDLAIGRNNWMFIASEAGGKCMAILYSIIATCKVNSIDLNEYLADVLMRLPMRTSSQSVADLTPVEWLKAKNSGKLPTPTPLYPSVG